MPPSRERRPRTPTSPASAEVGAVLSRGVHHTRNRQSLSAKGAVAMPALQLTAATLQLAANQGTSFHGPPRHDLRPGAAAPAY